MEDGWEEVDGCPYRVLGLKKGKGQRAVMRAFHKKMRYPHADAKRLTAAKDRILEELREVRGDWLEALPDAAVDADPAPTKNGWWRWLG